MKKRSEIMALAEAEGGVPIWGCLPGSPAALAGLQYGDILLSVNGQDVHAIGDYVEAKQNADGPFEVVVRRDAELLTFMVDPQAVQAGGIEKIARQVAEGRYFRPEEDDEPQKPN